MSITIRSLSPIDWSRLESIVYTSQVLAGTSYTVDRRILSDIVNSICHINSDVQAIFSERLSLNEFNNKDTLTQAFKGYFILKGLEDKKDMPKYLQQEFWGRVYPLSKGPVVVTYKCGSTQTFSNLFGVQGSINNSLGRYRLYFSDELNQSYLCFCDNMGEDLNLLIKEINPYKDGQWGFNQVARELILSLTKIYSDDRADFLSQRAESALRYAES